MAPHRPLHIVGHQRPQPAGLCLAYFEQELVSACEEQRQGQDIMHGAALERRMRPACGALREKSPCTVLRTQPGHRDLGHIASVVHWNESPQAQEPFAFGLSIVNPDFCRVSW